LNVLRFPVSGIDLMQRGFSEGKALGAELDRLEQLWINSGFSLGREELLAEAGRP
jgi:poly(A) polymerase